MNNKKNIFESSVSGHWFLSVIFWWMSTNFYPLKCYLWSWNYAWYCGALLVGSPWIEEYVFSRAIIFTESLKARKKKLISVDRWVIHIKKQPVKPLPNHDSYILSRQLISCNLDSYYFLTANQLNDENKILNLSTRPLSSWFDPY